MEVWKIIFLSKWVICRFYVNLPGCSLMKYNCFFFHPYKWPTLQGVCPFLLENFEALRGIEVVFSSFLSMSWWHDWQGRWFIWGQTSQRCKTWCNILQHHFVRFFVVVVFLRCAWNSKQPVLNGCFNWMIPSSYTENGCFTISIWKLVVWGSRWYIKICKNCTLILL